MITYLLNLIVIYGLPCLKKNTICLGTRRIFSKQSSSLLHRQWTRQGHIYKLFALKSEVSLCNEISVCSVWPKNCPVSSRHLGKVIDAKRNSLRRSPKNWKYGDVWLLGTNPWKDPPSYMYLNLNSIWKKLFKSINIRPTEYEHRCASLTVTNEQRRGMSHILF